MSELTTTILGRRPRAATAFGLQPARLTLRRLALAAAIAGLAAASGCGQKGPLYLPEPAATPPRAAAPTPARASAPAAASAASAASPAYPASPASAASAPTRP